MISGFPAVSMRLQSLLALFLGLFLPTAAALCGDLDLTVMTFNLRYASDTPPNAWPQRRPVMKACIETVRPDVIGTQEGLYRQLKDLARDLPDYTWIGTGRDGGSRGEFMAIFYRTARFEPMEYDHFWLSDTPDVIGSTTWGNENRRMVTWVRFRERETGREFYFWNTHWDHRIQTAREKSAVLIRKRIESMKPGISLILAGDFNAVAGKNPAYGALVDDGFLKDTWSLARERGNEDVCSFHDFSGPRKGTDRIDWILVRGEADVARSEIVTFQQNGQYPSDHFPVIARMTLKEP